MTMLGEITIGVAIAGRACAGLVFATAAAGKMRHWRFLEGVIANYRLLPGALVRPVAMALPPVELALGAALLLGVAAREAAMAGALLLLLFAAAMAVNIARGRSHIDCGCHRSVLRQTLSRALVGRNIALAAMLLPSLRVGAAGPEMIVTGFFAGLMLFLLYHLLNLILAISNRNIPLEYPA
ncbi:MAG TPA: MauE/DoxX family redox-associated membrane protein [Rhizomicrobium sp.]